MNSDTIGGVAHTATATDLEFPAIGLALKSEIFLDVIVETKRQATGRKDFQYGRSKMGDMGWTGQAGRRRRNGERRAEFRGGGGSREAICGGVRHVRRAIVYRTRLEMVHVLEVRFDEHGNGDGVTAERRRSRK